MKLQDNEIAIVAEAQSKFQQHIKQEISKLTINVVEQEERIRKLTRFALMGLLKCELNTGEE